METLPMRAEIFIPENKVSAWVSKKGESVINDKSMGQEDVLGEWVVEGYTLDNKKHSSEVWIFRDDDALGISRSVLENNPLQGTWGYAPSVDPRKARPQDIWFFPPRSAKCKIPAIVQEYNHKGTWVKPTFKRDFSQLGSNSSGFMNVSGDMKIAKGEKHSVAGKWSMLGYNDDVVRGKKKKKKDIGGAKKGPREDIVTNNSVIKKKPIVTKNSAENIMKKKPMVIFVIKEWNNYKFKLRVEPTNTIIEIKKMIEAAENIPVNQQRLTFKKKSVYNPKTLEQSKIGNKSILHLGEPNNLNARHPKIERKPRVEVKTQDCRSFYFDFDPEGDTFIDLKRKIANAVEIPIKDLNLLDNDNCLVDDSCMPSHGTVLNVAPQIEVALPDKSKVKLSMLPNMTIDDLKDIIEEKYGTPKAKQRIFCFDNDGDEFDDITPIKKMGIKHGSVLEMRPIPEDAHITVRSPDGRSFCLTFEPENDTVNNIKKKLSKEIGVPVKELPPLCLNDEELNDGYHPAKNDILNIKPYEIEVELPDRRRVVLSTLPTKTIGEIKDIVEEKTGLKKSDQRLFFFDNAGEEIGDDVPVKKVKIPAGTPLKILQRKEPKEVTIKDPTGRMFEFTIYPDEPVKNIKKRIAEKIGIPLGGLKLDDKLWTDIDEELALDEAGFMVRNGGILEVDAPEVEVALPNSAKIKLKILPTTTIRDVKKIIEEEAPELSNRDNSQRMFFLDSIAELDDDTPFEKLKFEQGQIIEMRSMTIRVQDWNGDKFELDVQTNWYLDDIKELICGLTNISPEQQNISFNGEPVKDQFQLMKQGIVHNSTLILEPMSIRVKVPSKNKPVQFAVNPTETIGKIKRKAMKKGKLNETHSPYDCCLVNGGQELDDNESLEKFDIQHNDLITLEEFALRIMHWSGKIFALDGVKRHDTVDSLKEKIFLMEDIPTEVQKLSLHGRRLEGPETLQKLNHRAILVLEPLDGDTDTLEAEKKTVGLMKSKTFKSRGGDLDEIMPVMPDWKRRIFFFDYDNEFDAYVDLFIMHWEGEKFMLDKILLNNTVSETKARIFNLKGIEKKSQKLKFDGILLDDKKTLLEQNVRHRSILVLDSPAENNIANPSIQRLSIFGMLPTKLLENITITVKHWNGDTFSLNPAPNDYIDDIKDSICDQKGIPVEQIRLSFQGQSTREDVNLFEQNIVDGSLLTLEPMQIFLQLPAKRKLVPINIEPDQTLSDIKKTIAKMMKIDFKLLCIMLGGDELENKSTILDCGIDHEDELRVEIFEIKIMHWSGEIFPLGSLGPNNTTHDVKKNIFESKSIPIEQQVLSLKGQVLNDVLRLKDQGVEHRAVLILDHLEVKAASAVKEKVSLTIFKTPANGDMSKSAIRSTLKQDDSPSEESKKPKEKNSKSKKRSKKKKTTKQ